MVFGLVAGLTNGLRFVAGPTDLPNPTHLIATACRIAAAAGLATPK